MDSLNPPKAPRKQDSMSELVGQPHIRAAYVVEDQDLGGDDINELMAHVNK